MPTERKQIHGEVRDVNGVDKFHVKIWRVSAYFFQTHLVIQAHELVTANILMTAVGIPFHLCTLPPSATLQLSSLGVCFLKPM